MVTDYENMDVFNFFQQEEIRKGLAKNLDVTIYARPELPYDIMRELRKSLESGVSLIPYVNAGYDSEQLLAIRHALAKGINIQPYLNIAYHGACIDEIAIGLEHNINVTPYADARYTWRKMREIRLGIEQRLDISQYANPLYSYWQMREIRLGLKDGLDIDSYKSIMYTTKEMHKRRMLLKSKRNTPSVSDKWTLFQDADYDIHISPDGINAYLSWHCNRAIANVSELTTILEKHSIVFGIDYAALEALAKEYSVIGKDSRKYQNTLVAKGIPAIHGRNGYYEWCFDTRKKRQMNLLADGSINYDTLTWYEPVTQNQTLAIYHYATAAVDGKTVTGQTIPAKAGKEKAILTGRGFEMLPDLKTYVAAKSGHVRLHRNELIVSDLIILDELYPMNEPLNFNSDVYIKGNVTGPVTLNVNGDLAVDGFVEAAQINCNGSLLLKRGINTSSSPDTGIVMVHGCVISKFFEYVTLHADDNIYFGTSLNSNLSSYGEIVSYGRKGGIIGGTSYSEKGYCLPNLGNPVGTNTTLLLGTNDNICSQRFAIKNEIANIKTMLTKLTTVYNTYCEKTIYTNPYANDLLQKAEHTIAVQNEALECAYQKMDALEKRQTRACQSKIIVEQNVYDNVQVHYMSKKITAIPSTQVAILINKDSLVMEKLYSCDPQTA